MKFGMNLLLWSGNIGEEHYPILENLKAMGYDGVEVPLFEYDIDRCAKLDMETSDMEPFSAQKHLDNKTNE